MSDGAPVSANEALAQTVVTELLDAGLIRKADQSAMVDALATGKVKQDDWVGWIENAIAAKEANHAQD